LGNKSGRKRQHILYILALGCLIGAMACTACAPLREGMGAGQEHRQLERFREGLAAGLYEAVIEEGRAIIAAGETEPPADTALYALGEAYAHPDYPGRDYGQSRLYFEKLIKHFPESPLTTEAKTYVALFEMIAAKEKKAAAQPPPPPPAEMPTAAEPRSIPPPLPRKVVEDQDFEEAVRRNLQLLDQAGQHHPADEALYNLGLIYAHADNPAKDYKKSQVYFHVLVKQFPDSTLAEEALIWLGIFDTIDKMQQIDSEIEQQKKQLTR